MVKKHMLSVGFSFHAEICAFTGNWGGIQWEIT